MKNKFKIIILLTVLLLNFGSIYSQVSVTISHVIVDTNPVNGFPINIGTSVSKIVRFRVTVTKPNSLSLGNCYLSIGTYTTNGSYTSQYTPQFITYGLNNTGSNGTYEFELFDTDMDFFGGCYLSAKLEQTTGTPPLNWTSNPYPIKKLPTYTYTQSATSVICGNTSPIIFSVNSNAPASVNQYNWNYGSGWTLNSPTTTGTTVSLTPTVYPPGLVFVTPTFNNELQPFNTFTVSQAPFTSTATITGSTAFCTFPTASNYTISAGAGNAVTWSSSNTDVATVSAGTNSQVTVTTQSQGFFTLTALITNACGQTATKTKLISVGGPSFGSISCGKFSRDFCSGKAIEVEFGTLPVLDLNDKVTATFFGLTAAEANNNANWDWEPLNNLVTVSKTKNLCRIGLLNYGQTGVRVRALNSCGWSAWTDLLFEVVELPLGNQRMSVTQTIFAISPNPSSDYININVKENENINLKNQPITAELFDMFFVSRKRFEIQKENPLIDVENIEKGIYILKITIDGHTENHQVIIK